MLFPGSNKHRYRQRNNPSDSCLYNCNGLLSLPKRKTRQCDDHINMFDRRGKASPCSSSLIHGMRKRVSASLTIEAAMCLSIFLFAMSMFLGFFPAMSISMRIQAAMEEAAESVAMYTYGIRALGNLEITQTLIDEYGPKVDTDDSGEGFMSQSDLNDLISQGSAMILLHAKIISLVGGEELDNSCIRGGRLGLTTFGSSVPDDEDRYLVKVSYLVKFPFPLGLIPDMPITQRCCWRAWTGADKGKSEKKEEQEEESKEIVYITEDGKVYHTTTSCSYLDLTIHSVAASSVPGLRNKSGAKYKPCERCTVHAVTSGSVFISKYGDRYHLDRDCGGLKRTVKAVEKDSISLPACSRCGKSAA